MAGECSSKSSRIPDMGEEDCSYFLRELEEHAFSTVVSAFRAQGVFNKFKETVLESLKTALFISDETYKAEVRKAANDDLLSKVAAELNPSYDTFTEWGTLGLDADDDVRIIPQPKYFDGSTTLSVADQLLNMANAHNDRVEDNDAIMAGLLQLPKQPYVPERLRKLLRDTESLHTDRILPPKVENFDDSLICFSEPSAKKTPKPVVRRRRKSKANGLRDEFDLSPILKETPERLQQPSTSRAAPPGPPPLSPQKSSEAQAAALLAAGLLPSSKDAETLGVKEFINKIQLQIEEEQRIAVADQGNRRKRKPRQSLGQKEGSQECARARPFVFPAYGPDGLKPPRGNPDRIPTPRGRSIPPATAGPQPPASPVTASQQSAMGPPPIPAAAIQHQQQLHQTPGPSQAGSSSATEPSPTAFNTARDNTIVAVRRMESSASIPVSSIVSKPSPAAQGTPGSSTSAYKRPRVASFNESLSASDMQRSNIKGRAPFLQTTPVNKVKVMGAEQQQGTNPSTPTRTFYSAGLPVVNVNRPQHVQVRTPATSTPSAQGSSPSANTVTPSPSTSDGAEYGVQKAIFKRNIYKTPSSASVRLANGTITLGQKTMGTPPPGGTPSSITVVMKKPTPPPGPVNANMMTVIHRPSPPPAMHGSPSSSNMVPIVRRIVTTTSIQNPQIPVNHVVSRKSSVQPSSPLVNTIPEPAPAPPAPKRLIYCDPQSNTTIITTSMGSLGADFEIPTTPQTDAAFQPPGGFDTPYGSTTPIKDIHDYGAQYDFMDDGIRRISDPNEPNDPIPGLNHGYEKPLTPRMYRVAPGPAQSPPFPQPISASPKEPSETSQRQSMPDILQQSMMEIT